MRKLLPVMGKAGEVSKVDLGRYIHPDRSDLVSAGNAHTPGNTGNAGNTYRCARDGEASG